jgi:hypothetical protein
MVKFLYDNFCQFPFDVTDVINDGNEYGSSELGSLCEGGKICDCCPNTLNVLFVNVIFLIK